MCAPLEIWPSASASMKSKAARSLASDSMVWCAAADATNSSQHTCSLETHPCTCDLQTHTRQPGARHGLLWRIHGSHASPPQSCGCCHRRQSRVWPMMHQSQAPIHQPHLAVVVGVQRRSDLPDLVLRQAALVPQAVLHHHRPMFCDSHISSGLTCAWLHAQLQQLGLVDGDGLLQCLRTCSLDTGMRPLLASSRAPNSSRRF